MPKKLLVLLTLALGACGRRDIEVAAASGGVAPFGGMRGVHLGMTARELARVRPAARPAGYTGYVEDVDGFSVAYGIPGSDSDEQVVPPGARVRAVSAARNVGGIDSGMAEWRRTVQTARTALKSSPVCSRIDTGTGIVGLEAEWKRRGSSFNVSVYETAARGEVPSYVRVLLQVTRKPSQAGAPGGRSRADCNSTLRDR